MVNRKKILEFLTMIYWNKLSRWDSIDTSHLKTTVNRMLDNQINLEPDKKEEYQELFSIIEKFHDMMSDSEIRKYILETGISKQDFMFQYAEELLGDDKRTYNMSSLFDPHHIMSCDENQIGIGNKKIRYLTKNCQEHIFFDDKGKKITIQEIGKLYFTHWNGLQDDVSQYKILRQIDGEQDLYEAAEVFSNIRFIHMDDPQYRQAVFYELLGKNNREFSNAGGYIGEIADIPVGAEQTEIGSEGMINQDYYYRINEKYALKYDKTVATAAMIYEQEKKKLVKFRNKAEDQEKLSPASGGEER